MAEAARAARGSGGYAILTLLAAVVAIVAWGGTGARAWGILAAWAIQAAAFWRLDRALRAGRNAVREWIGGIAMRGGGFVLAAGLAWGGRASAELPIAYGIAMLVLLLAEAGWLIQRLPRRPASPSPAGDVNELDRTHSTG